MCKPLLYNNIKKSLKLNANLVYCSIKLNIKWNKNQIVFRFLIKAFLFWSKTAFKYKMKYIKHTINKKIIFILQTLHGVQIIFKAHKVFSFLLLLLLLHF